MERTDLNPTTLNKTNSAFNKEQLQRLCESMRESGWKGRPLLVERAKTPGLPFQLLYAWTGSHRITAAQEVGLSIVPCVVLPPEMADPAFTGAGYPLFWHRGYSCWRDAITASEGMMDADRLRGLEKAGLVEAAAMLREELEATDGHGA